MAYVDPNSGSLILQIVAAGALTAAFTVKSWWYRAKGLVRSGWQRLRGR